MQDLGAPALSLVSDPELQVDHAGLGASASWKSATRTSSRSCSYRQAFVQVLHDRLGNAVRWPGATHTRSKSCMID